MSSRAGLIAIIGFLPLAATGCGGAPDAEQTHRFQAAQAAFDQAQTPADFLRAAGMYQEILDTGLVSGAVLYNQGNALMRANQRGRAIACYRQAQRFRPRDPYLDHNLRCALGTEDNRPRPVVEYLLFWQDWLSYAAKFQLVGAVGGLTFAAAVASLFWRRRGMKIAIVAGGALTVVLALSAAYDWSRFEGVTRGVVIADNVVARKGDAEAYEPAFTQPLSEGAEFEVRQQRGAWLLIRLPGAKEGWVRSEQVVVY